MKRYLGYARVSTSEQADAGNGLEDQRLKIQAACVARDAHLIEIAEDAGFSGSKADNRPALQGLLKRLKNREADGLVVSKLDRLSRSLWDFADIARMAEKQRWSLVVLDCQLDTGTPTGELMIGMLVLFSQFERRLISQRTRDGLARVRARGIKLGGSPVPLEAGTLRFIMALHREGTSFRLIAKQLNDLGLLTPSGSAWYPATVRTAVLRATGASGKADLGLTHTLVSPEARIAS